MAANAAKKRAVVKPLSPAAINGALLQMGMARRAPKWSNGWRFEGEPYETKVFLNVSRLIFEGNRFCGLVLIEYVISFLRTMTHPLFVDVILP